MRPIFRNIINKSQLSPSSYRERRSTNPKVPDRLNPWQLDIISYGLTKWCTQGFDAIRRSNSLHSISKLGAIIGQRMQTILHVLVQHPNSYIRHRFRCRLIKGLILGHPIKRLLPSQVGQCHPHSFDVVISWLDYLVLMIILVWLDPIAKVFDAIFP